MWPPSYKGKVQSRIWFEMVLGPFKIKAEGVQAERSLGENSLKPIFRLGVAYAFNPCIQVQMSLVYKVRPFLSYQNKNSAFQLKSNCTS